MDYAIALDVLAKHYSIGRVHCQLAEQRKVKARWIISCPSPGFTQRDQVVSCATLMLSFEMECSWSSTQFHQDRVAAKLEKLQQAHTSEEVAASADLEPQLDVVVLPFSRLSKVTPNSQYQMSFHSREEKREGHLSKFPGFDLSVEMPVF